MNDWRKASNPPGLQAKNIGSGLALSERLAYATARLECWDAVGTESVGTAFFFDFAVREKDVVPVLVTNKHVVEGARSGRLRLHGVENDASDVKLLGIVYAMFTYDAKGEIVAAPIPANAHSVVRLDVPTNLGLALKATRLLDFSEELERRSRSA